MRRLSRVQKLKRRLERVAHHRHYKHAHGLAYLCYYGAALLEDRGFKLVIVTALFLFVGISSFAGADD